MTCGEPNAVAFDTSADEGELVGSRGPVPGPDPDGRELRQAWKVLHGALEHSVQDGLVDASCFGVILPGRANQHLPVFARLDIECDRISGHAMSAFEIAQFHNLVVDET